MTEKQNAVALIRDLALDESVNPEKFRALLDVQKDWEANEARKAFALAITGFQSECPIIAPMDQGAKNVYAKLDRIHRETRPLREKYGLAVVWTKVDLVDEGRTCRLEGVLTHRDGHSIDTAYSLPLPDAIVSGAGNKVQNDAQRMGSATSYARRYGECAVLGIVTGQDDDAEGLARATETIDEGQSKVINGLLKQCPDPGDTARKVLDFAGVESVEEIPAAKFEAIVKKLNATLEAADPLPME